MVHSLSRAGICASLCLLVCFSSGRAADEPVWNGPLPLQNERPFQALFLDPAPENPDLLRRGQTRWALQLDVANNLLRPESTAGGDSVEEDFETQRLKVAWRRGYGRGWEVGAATNLTARNGGVMDGLIESYHSLTGLEGNGRDNPVGRENRPRGRSRLFFRDADGDGVEAGTAFGLGDSSLWVKRGLSTGRTASALRLLVKLPTGSESKLLGSGGLDVGLAADVRYALTGRFALQGNLGVTHFGSTSIPNARSGGVQGGFGLEWRLGRRDALLAQLDAGSRTVRTGNTFADRVPVMGSIGYARRVNANRTLWVSLSENGDYTNYHAPVLGNIGPDLTLSAGYTWTR